MASTAKKVKQAPMFPTEETVPLKKSRSKKKALSVPAINAAVTYMTVTNYDMFKRIDGNRDLDEAHVKRLMRSMQRMGNISAIIAHQEGKSLMISDGQHRIEACKRLGIPVQVLVVRDKTTAMQIAQLNAVQKKWNTYDYLNQKAETQKDAAAGFILNEVESLSEELKTPFSPLPVWALITGEDKLSSHLKKEERIPIAQDAFKIYKPLREKFVHILSAASQELRVTLKQAATTQALHDLLLDPLFDHKEFAALLTAGKAPGLMSGARKKLQNLQVLVDFYVNNMNKSAQFRKEMRERLGLTA